MEDNNPTGETMEEGDYSGVEESGEGSGEDAIILTADMFGDVQPKEGDRITFCVTKDPDSSGNVTGYFMSEKKPENTKESSDRWDREMIAAVSPTSSREEGQ